ncbi:hypothetical protein G6F43_013994 [Rhizopus delemar]|nr:hypothetical protein G6F43_013994 [Rhizopus delemar]
MSASTMVHSDTWPPQFSHWCCRPVPHKQVPVASISPGELRRSWHPVLAGSRRLLRPPYRVAPGLRLPVSSWKEFWAFDIPSSAFTPWWRLLHDSLPVASTLHRRNVTSCASPVCRICHSAVEDTFHFVVGCPLKWQFWSSVLSLFRLTDQFPEATSVWSALATLSSPDNRYTICSDHIRPFGFAFSSLWKFHWRCVLNSTPWSLSGAMNFFQQESKLLFESSLVTEF